jgi:hypothetical protein
MKAQQDEIDALRQQLSAKDQQVTDTQQAATAAQTQAAAAAAAAQQANEAATASTSQTQALQSTVTDLKNSSAGLQETVIKNQADIKTQIESPAALHYKGVTITPVAFFAFEGVWRQHSVSSDINTPFNSIPFPSANEYQATELNFSGRQSRLGALVQANAGTFNLTGYAEMDFLGTGTSSNNNQSNSYVLRQRQIWGQAATQGGFAVTGGQMWSLVTEDRHGTDARTEIQPQTIDPQYLVGYSWTRQPEIRLQKRFGNYNTGAFTLAASLEQAQITNYTVASAATASIPTEYFFAGVGQNGGLYNAAASAAAGNAAPSGAITTYANNVAPDLIVKGAFDYPHVHFEVGGIARWLRDYYYPIIGTTGTGSTAAYQYGTSYNSSTASAGGGFGSIRVTPDRFFEVAFQMMAGTGVGRYGSSQLADATLRPNETLEPIRNYHGLFSLETHPTKKLDIFGYYGGEYAQRTVYTVETGGTGAFNGDLIGYGAPNLNNGGCDNVPPAPTGSNGSGGSISATSCSGPTRYIQEPMFGFIYRVVNDPKYGRLQYSFTYSYLKRQLWSGTPSATTPASPSASDNMLHWSMRYYIP